ncbi:MAG: hypothetical protein IJ438_06000 [Clostridia bacterium]|nr:hypothetical protein [Clostridia bacterium]
MKKPALLALITVILLAVILALISRGQPGEARLTMAPPATVTDLESTAATVGDMTP